MNTSPSIAAMDRRKRSRNFARLDPGGCAALQGSAISMSFLTVTWRIRRSTRYLLCTDEGATPEPRSWERQAWIGSGSTLGISVADLPPAIRQPLRLSHRPPPLLQADGGVRADTAEKEALLPSQGHFVTWSGPASIR